MNLPTLHAVDILEDDDPFYTTAYHLVQSRQAREARVVTPTGEVMFRAHGVGHRDTFLWEAHGVVMTAPYTPFEDDYPLRIPQR